MHLLRIQSSLSKQQFLWTTAKPKLVNTQSCEYTQSVSYHTLWKRLISDRKVTSCVYGFSSTTPCTYIKVYFCFDPLCLAKILVFLLQWIPRLCRRLRLCLQRTAVRRGTVRKASTSCTWNLQTNPGRQIWSIKLGSGMLPARSNSTGETQSTQFNRLGRSSTVPNRGLWGSAGEQGGKTWGGESGRRNEAERSEENTVWAPSWLCLHLGKPIPRGHLPPAHSVPTTWEKHRQELTSKEFQDQVPTSYMSQRVLPRKR